MLPALLRAYKLQEKAGRVGFDWPEISGAVDKLQEEINEYLLACKAQSLEQIEDEMGDILFAVVNIARMSGVEPEQALQRTNDKFTRRFSYIERKIEESGEPLEEAGLIKLDRLWEEAKLLGL